MLNFAVYFVCTHWLYYVVGVLHLDPVGSADVATQPLVLKGYFWTKPYQGSISTKTREFSISDKDLQCGCSRCWGCFWTKSVCLRVFHKLPKNIENLQTDWRSCPWLVLFTFAFLVVHICFFSGYKKHIFGVDKPDCNYVQYTWKYHCKISFDWKFLLYCANLNPTSTKVDSDSNFRMSTELRKK